MTFVLFVTSPKIINLYEIGGNPHDHQNQKPHHTHQSIIVLFVRCSIDRNIVSSPHICGLYNEHL